MCTFRGLPSTHISCVYSYSYQAEYIIADISGTFVYMYLATWNRWTQIIVLWCESPMPITVLASMACGRVLHTQNRRNTL